MKGYTLFTDGDRKFWWKDCTSPECSNQVCTWLSNDLCYPCTMKKVRDISSSVEWIVNKKEAPQN